MKLTVSPKTPSLKALHNEMSLCCCDFQRKATPGNCRPYTLPLSIDNTTDSKLTWLISSTLPHCHQGWVSQLPLRSTSWSHRCAQHRGRGSAHRSGHPSSPRARRRQTASHTCHGPDPGAPGSRPISYMSHQKLITHKKVVENTTKCGHCAHVVAHK